MVQVLTHERIVKEVVKIMAIFYLPEKPNEQRQAINRKVADQIIHQMTEGK